MKQTLLIDINDTLINKNFQEEQLFDQILNEIEQNFELQKIKNFQIDLVQLKLQKLKPQNLNLKWQKIFQQIYHNYKTEEVVEFIQSKIQQNWTKKKGNQLLPYVMDNVCYADFHYLNMQYDVIFFLVGQFNQLQKLLIETVLQQYIDLNQLRYFESPDIINLLNIIDSQKTFIVSQDIQQILELLNNHQNFENFNFSQQFIHVYLENITMEKYEQQQQILVAKKVEHDLMTLKNLYNKLENIKKMQQKNFKRSEIIKVGVYFEDGIYKHDRKGFVMMDKYPLYFTHFDPLSCNNKKDINIYSAKYSYLMNFYKLFSDDQIKDLLIRIQQVLKEIEQRNKYKILIPNNLENFMVFAERQEMANYFIELFNDDKFKQKLQENFGKELTLGYPQTFTIEQIDPQSIKKQMEQYNIQFPIIIKSSYCIAILSDYSHDVIFIKNEEQLGEFIQKEEKKLKLMSPLIVQQYILDLQDIQKIYFIFDEKLLTRYQGIDDDIENSKKLNGHKDLKNYSDIKDFTDLEKQLQNFIGQQLKQRGLYNLGLDLCCRKDTQQFYIIDTNADSLSWMNHGNKQEQQNRYYDNMMKCYESINQFIMQNQDLKKQISDKNFNIKLYIEKDLSKILNDNLVVFKKQEVDNLVDIFSEKIKQIQQQLLELENSKSKTQITKEASERRNFKKLQMINQDYNNVKLNIFTIQQNLGDQVRYIKNLKQQVDRLQQEKNKIMNEYFVIDIVLDMKKNNGQSKKIKTFEQKIQFSQNIKEIENHIMLYEKQLLNSFYNYKSQIEQEFLELLENQNNEVNVKDIIDYFIHNYQENKIYQMVCENELMQLDFDNITSVFDQRNLQNIKQILENFFLMIKNFYINRKLMEDTLLYYFNEDMFFKLTNFIFQSYINKYLKIILQKNYEEKKEEFYLEYLDKIYQIFQEKNNEFEQTKQYSIYFYDLIISEKISILDLYLQNYFQFEQKYFQYTIQIYVQIIKEKLIKYFNDQSNEQNYQKILDNLNNERMEQYINFVKKSINRCNQLSQQSHNFIQVNQLVIYSLDNFDELIKFMLNGLIKIIPDNQKQNIYIQPLILKIIEFLFIFLIRININHKCYIQLIKKSNFFIETDEKRKQIIEKIKNKIILLNNKIFTNVMEFTKKKITTSIMSNEFQILNKLKQNFDPYLNQFDNILNQEIKDNMTEIFQQKSIQLIDELFFKYYKKQKKKINMLNEFKIFFEIFNSTQNKQIESQITALKYFLLCLKSQEKNISKFVDQTSNERIDSNKIQLYQKFLDSI